MNTKCKPTVTTWSRLEKVYYTVTPMYNMIDQTQPIIYKLEPQSSNRLIFATDTDLQRDYTKEKE